MASAARRTVGGLALIFGTGLASTAVVACGDSGSRSGESSTSTSVTTPRVIDPTTTTAVPDLAAARVALTPIAPVAQPTALATRRGDAALFVAEQGGRVRAVRDGVADPEPVLDLSGRVSAGGERGLLGLAFSTDGTLLYVHYSDTAGDTQVDEYTMGATAADPASRRPLLSVDQPQPNHNGGQLTLGPDGMLWLGVGDGGGGGDIGSGHAPGGNGQALDTLLGKIVRIDPNPGPASAYTIPADNPFAAGGGEPEIWAYGLRNPWRFSFDRDTGDLWIADVGQNAWEEVNLVPAGQGAGWNFGWARLEGTHSFNGDPPPDAVPPVFEYSHAEGCSVTGGYVYRGAAIPDLVGSYVFADYCAGQVRAIRVEGGQVVTERLLDVAVPDIAAFGEDAVGDLFVLSQRDGLLRVDPAPA